MYIYIQIKIIIHCGNEPAKLTFCRIASIRGSILNKYLQVGIRIVVLFVFVFVFIFVSFCIVFVGFVLFFLYFKMK